MSSFLTMIRGEEKRSYQFQCVCSKKKKTHLHTHTGICFPAVSSGGYYLLVSDCIGILRFEEKTLGLMCKSFRKKKRTPEEGGCITDAPWEL